MTIRVYADTSVFGGVFDTEFQGPSRKFFELVESGDLVLVVSLVVIAEVSRRPARLLESFLTTLRVADIRTPDQEILALQRGYLAAGILTTRSADDAVHVATATGTGCDLIASWNFRQIVRFDRIPLYNAVNQAYGYRPIVIHSPDEVIRLRDKEV